MSVITFDIEADNLLRDATCVWCMSVKVDNNEAELYIGCDAIEKAHMLQGYVDQGHTLVGHNISGYDIPLLKKLFNIDIDISKCTDTLLLSQMLEPEEFSHSLESWGEYLGDEKVKHEDWTQYSEAMGIRCKKDCDITKLIYDKLNPQVDKLKFRHSLEVEMSFNNIMAWQEVAGWSFDIDQAGTLIVYLDAEIQRLTDSILLVAPKRILKNESTKLSHTKGGKAFTSFTTRWYNSLNAPCFALEDISGDYCVFDVQSMNLNSVTQVKEYLLTLGWIPTEFNYRKDGNRIIKDSSGKPIVSSAKLSNLESVQGEVGEKISKRILYSHRRNQIRGWTERVRSDGRLEARGVSCGCNTNRVRHINIVNVPKASEDVFLGKAMRSLFKVKDGYLLVGADLDQLEARIAGNFTWKYDNGEYAELLLQGDPHAEIAELFGCSRAVGKQATYALLYGAQIPKLAAILRVNESRAAYLWHKWWETRSSLSALREDIIQSIESRGYDRKKPLNSAAYVKSIDKRPIFIRSWHSVLNALIQSSGSILFKEIVCRQSFLIKETGLDATLVGNFHDELNSEVHPDCVDAYKNILTEACNYVNIKYDLKVPLTLDIKVGDTWAEVH